jgi:glyoxylase-like metal-dependent hydrolase (beta-lactamase superfamily II)
MKLLNKIGLIGLLLASSATLAAEDKAKAKFSATKVSPGLYMLMGVGGFTGGNIGLSVGEDGVVLIDDALPSSLAILQDAIKVITKQPIDFLINTHVHGDHTGNNEVIGRSGARIVAHENLRKHMLEKGVASGNSTIPAPQSALPVITFSHSMNFHLNGNDAHIFHVANAHTDGDAVIHFKNANVIHTGDTLFNKMFPYIDLDSGGSVDGYIKAQKKSYSLADENTKIIPGHGQLATKQDLGASIAMLEDSKKLIGGLIKQGKSEDEVVKLNPLKKYHAVWSWPFITTEKMTRQMYKGLKSERPAKHKLKDNAQVVHQH